MISGWTETLDPRQLSTVEAEHFGDADRHYRKLSVAAFEGMGYYLDDLSDHAGPFHRTEHYFGAGFTWTSMFIQQEPWPDDPESFFAVGSSGYARRLAAGATYVERWNQAPFGPAFADTASSSGAQRTGDELWIWPSMYSDRSALVRWGDSITQATRDALFRNGQLLAEWVDEPGEIPPVPVPAEPATYRFESSYERGPNPFTGEPIFDLSTRVDAAWTFRSRHVPGDAPQSLPLPVLSFLPELDAHARAHARAIVLPVAIERPARAARPRIARVEIEASFDDGATWARVPGVLLGERWIGIVRHEPGAAYASLRGTAVDVDGNRVDQTLIHAYRIAPR
jgi:hypothetical protein